MDEKALAYFSLVNPLARKIIKDQRMLRDALGDDWNNLEWRKQEEIIDDFFVDISVREKFANIKRSHEYPVSFPKLKVETGEKIVVDFENDCWTWQDEHSSPFNWRTKSQQDLTLDDLDDEVLSKPVKQKKKESPSNTSELTTAPREFSVNAGGSIWESPFLQGMKKPDFLNRSRSESPAKSTTTSRESLARSKTPEEVNYAFTGSMDDLSSAPSVDPDQRSPSVSSAEILQGSPRSDIEDNKSGRRHRSFSKSPIRNVLASSKDQNPDKGALVSDRDEEANAFDNPALGHEWSNFVNEDEGPESATPSPYRKLLKEPEPVSMDRGDHSGIKLIAGSQYMVRGDNQSVNLMAGSQVDEDQDEILVVEQRTPLPLDVTDQHNASSLSKTGFDFLDNW